MFSIHTMPEDLKNATITGNFGFVFEETSVSQGNHMTIVTPLFSKKLHFQNSLRPHGNKKPFSFS